MSVEIVTLRLNLSLPDDRSVWQWMTTMCPADIRGRKQYLSRLVVSGLVGVAREQLRNNAGGVNVAFPPIPDELPSDAGSHQQEGLDLRVVSDVTSGVEELNSPNASPLEISDVRSHMKNRVKVLPKV